jgi:hypothetical protein
MHWQRKFSYFLIALASVVFLSNSMLHAQNDLSIYTNIESDDWWRLNFNKNADEIEREKQLREKTFPLFVFLPGILGSAIYECDEADKCEDLLWGSIEQIVGTADLRVHPDREYKAKLLGQMEVAGFPIDIYGKAIKYINDKQFSNIHSLLAFPYDWRRSNIVTAKNFHLFLCAELPQNKNRKIIVLAHSMGASYINIGIGP